MDRNVEIEIPFPFFAGDSDYPTGTKVKFRKPDTGERNTIQRACKQPMKLVASGIPTVYFDIDMGKMQEVALSTLILDAPFPHEKKEDIQRLEPSATDYIYNAIDKYVRGDAEKKDSGGSSGKTQQTPSTQPKSESKTLKQ